MRRIAKTLLAVCGSAAAVAACSADPPGHYPMSPSDVYQRLANENLQAFMRNRQCGVLIQIERDVLPGRSVTWTVLSSGRPMLHFTANLTPVNGKHTKVSIDISKEANGREAYDGSQFYRRPAVKQPVRPAIEEQIAAILEGRPFNGNGLASKPSALSGQPVVKFRDSVCDVQRGGLESGRPFSVDDPD